MIGRMTTVVALILASILGLASILAGECAAARRDPRLAQYSVPDVHVPGGLPGVAVPPPARAPVLPAPAPNPAPSPSPTLRAPEAAPSVAVPPPPPPVARAPEAHGTEGCDCHAEVDVPVYANGQIVLAARAAADGPQSAVLSEMSVGRKMQRRRRMP